MLIDELNIFLVGGAVRDQLLGRTVIEKDWVVVGATPQQMLDLGFKVVGKDFPVFLHPETKEEYALARTEKKTGHGYVGFSFNASSEVTLEEDLMRRDLTINAIAQEPNGELIDPYQGVADLQARILRHVSPAFVEDPVRVLRVARFAARYFKYGFRLATETLELMKIMVGNGEVNHLVPERVWQETCKALTESHPSVYFSVLRNCGALAVIFPELDHLYGVPNPLKWHPEIDSGVHTMMVLEAAVKLSDDPMVRFAALVHDLGKAQTPSELWPKHTGHEERSVTLIQALAKRLAIPKEYKELAVLVGRYHGLCHKVFELKPSTIVKTLERLDCYRRPQRFFNFLLACQADHHGRTGYQDEEYTQGAFWREAYHVTQQINIQDLIEQGVTGKAIAEQLNQRRIAAVKKLL